MFKKPALMAAFGIGYVLGARAGRERYDALAAKAQELWHDPRVQEKAHRAGDAAKAKAETARHTIQDKLPGDSTPPPEATTAPPVAPSAQRPGMSADPVTDVPRGWES